MRDGVPPRELAERRARELAAREAREAARNVPESVRSGGASPRGSAQRSTRSGGRGPNEPQGPDQLRPRVAQPSRSRARRRATRDSLPTARGALRRSLVIWGWGQIAAGDRRGVALALAELAGIAILVSVVPPLVDGAMAPVVFGAGLIFVAAWGAVAIDAYRRMVRVRQAAGLPGADGGATELLWLAPVAIGGMLLLWGMGGTLARPDAALNRYVRDWRTGDAADAATLFVSDPTVARVLDAWSRHDAKLRNDLVRLAGSAGPDAGIDPDRPFDSVRFDAADATAGTAPVGADGAVVAARIVRRETVRSTFFGLFPTSSETLVPVEELGTITLRRVERPTSGGPIASNPVWLVERVDLLGVSLPN